MVLLDNVVPEFSGAHVRFVVLRFTHVYEHMLDVVIRQYAGMINANMELTITDTAFFSSYFWTLC